MSRQESDVTLREWTTVIARIRFGTVDVGKGKKVSGSVIKAVGLRMASYADADGSRVHPGLARIAVDLELSHQAVKRAHTVLVKTGLLRLVGQGSAKHGAANEYQLSLPVDLLDRDDVEVWSPARYTLEVERVRASVRGRRATRGGGDGPGPSSGVRGTWDPAQDSDSPECAGYLGHDGPVDNPDVQGPRYPARGVGETGCAGYLGPTNPGVRGTWDQMCGVPGTPPPTSDLDTTTTSQPQRDHRRDLAVARARGSGQDRSLEVVQTDPTPTEPPPAPIAAQGATDPPPARTGLGFCVACYAAGQTTVATDPIAGSHCAHHTREAIPA